MKTFHLKFLVVFASLTALLSCGGGPPAGEGVAGVPADSKWLFAGEDLWIPVVDTLTYDLKTASVALAEKQPAAAAVALREGATFLESQVEGSTPEGRAKLTSAAAKMKSLADSLDAGTTISVSTFENEMREIYSVDVDYRWGTAAPDEWMPWVQQIQEHLEAARERITAKMSGDAAIELRKAAALLRLEAGRFDGAEKQAVEGSWFEVRQLGAKAQVGGVTDTARLDWIAAHTCQTLAQAHQAEALDLWDDHQASRSGQVLDLAANELDRGLDWMGAETDREAKDAVETARRLAEQLAANPAPAAKEVSKTMEEIGVAIKAFGQTFEPHRAA